MTSSAPYQQQPRSPRVPYPGAVRLMIPLAPFRLLLHLRGLNLSVGGVCAQLPPSPAKDSAGKADSLLAQGDIYALQLEPHAGDLPAAVVRGRLVRRTTTTAGLELAFAFTPPGDDGVAALVDDLTGGHG